MGLGYATGTDEVDSCSGLVIDERSSGLQVPEEPITRNVRENGGATAAGSVRLPERGLATANVRRVHASPPLRTPTTHGEMPIGPAGMACNSGKRLADATEFPVKTGRNGPVPAEFPG
jgi:hypothetical protein